jgi:hypothetical protein
VATLTTSSILNPELTISDPWLEIFTAAYVLIGIGILVEVARRLGMAFIAARAGVRGCLLKSLPSREREPRSSVLPWRLGRGGSVRRS